MDRGGILAVEFTQEGRNEAGSVLNNGFSQRGSLFVFIFSNRDSEFVSIESNSCVGICVKFC